MIGDSRAKEFFVDNKRAIEVKTYLGLEVGILIDESRNKQIFLAIPNFGSDYLNRNSLLIYDSVIKTIKFN